MINSYDIRTFEGSSRLQYASIVETTRSLNSSRSHRQHLADHWSTLLPASLLARLSIKVIKYYFRESSTVENSSLIYHRFCDLIIVLTIGYFCSLGPHLEKTNKMITYDDQTSQDVYLLHLYYVYALVM